MPEFDGTLLTVLTATCLVLLVVILALLIRISSRLGMLTGQTRQLAATTEPVDGSPTAGEVSAGGAFELFLSEDSSRRELSKGDQFSAYRKWRQEKGMNWSNS